MAGVPSLHSRDAEDSSISKFRRKLDDVGREVKEIKNKFADFEGIQSTVSALQDTIKSEMKKMRDESEAVNQRIMVKIEKIHNYLKGESDAGKERPVPASSSGR